MWKWKMETDPGYELLVVILQQVAFELWAVFEENLDTESCIVSLQPLHASEHIHLSGVLNQQWGEERTIGILPP